MKFQPEKLFFTFFFLFSLTLTSLFVPNKTPAASCTTLKNNTVVTASTTFCSGSYSFADNEVNGVISVAADNIVIDGGGLSLSGKRNKGYGIYLNGYKGVTIQNFNITKFYYGLRLENADSLLIQNNNLSGNKKTDNSFLNINQPLFSAYGGGILASSITNSTFQNNVLKNQNVGLDLYNSLTNQVLNNDASQNSAWGFHLYSSSSNTISNNQAHHVNRCRNSGCDSAGIQLTNASNNNWIEGNNLTYSGDGFFIGNQYSLPSNFNTVKNNDASYSPNNAFETTFSEGNVFTGNTASGSNYGFWLGYSHHSRVENNTVQNNRTDGINIDRGSFMTLTNNTISGNGRYGIALTYLSGTRPETSHDQILTANTIFDNASAGVYLQDTTNSTLQNNKISGNKNNLYFTGVSTGNLVNQNNIICASLSGQTCQYNAYNNMATGNDADATNNWWGTADPAQISQLIFDGLDDSAKGRVYFEPWLTSPLP